MPKIKDLGIKVIPETMRPPEIGGGAACAVTARAQCPIHTICLCTLIQTICHCSHPYTYCFGCTLGHCTLYYTPCLCSNITPICPLHSVACEFGTQGGCGFGSPVIDPGQIGQPVEFTREQIAALKDQLQKQIAALDEHAKTIGPRTAEEIDARERQLNDELASLKARRRDIDKK